MAKKGRLYYQRKHRKTKVRRFEVVFNPDYGNDHQAIEYIDSLPRGTRSDFVRHAILQAVARELAPPENDDDLRALLHEALDRLAEVQHPPANTHLLQGPRPLTRGPAPDDDGDPVVLDVRTDTTTNSSANFLTSLMNLQH